MKTSTIVWIVIVLVILGGGWWWLSQGSAAPASGTPSTNAGINGSPNQGNLGATSTGTVQQPMADGAEGSVIGDNVALGTDGNATLGTYLIGYTGMTVYSYSPDTDTPGKSQCTGQCAVNWPPYIVGPEDNLTHLKAGVTGKVSTITRADGSLQVTYNGKPLYFYIQDKTSSDTKGEGVGGIWYVVKP